MHQSIHHDHIRHGDTTTASVDIGATEAARHLLVAVSCSHRLQHYSIFNSVQCVQRQWVPRRMATASTVLWKITPYIYIYIYELSDHMLEMEFLLISVGLDDTWGAVLEVDDGFGRRKKVWFNRNLFSCDLVARLTLSAVSDIF